MTYSWHAEAHFSTRNNWLRAGVLGANDGLISTASLLMGMAAANPGTQMIILTGIAALIAGAISMAAGEYVSVSSQADTERADLRKEQHELEHNPEQELEELTIIYQQRGLERELAQTVAVALTKHNALEAHARDEIGITDALSANPLEAAGASALAFCFGAIIPVAMTMLFSGGYLMGMLALSTLFGLALLGYISAKLGGAPIKPALTRILTWGIIALVSTSLIGHFFGVAL